MKLSTYSPLADQAPPAMTGTIRPLCSKRPRPPVRRGIQDPVAEQDPVLGDVNGGVPAGEYLGVDGIGPMLGVVAGDTAMQLVGDRLAMLNVDGSDSSCPTSLRARRHHPRRSSTRRPAGRVADHLLGVVRRGFGFPGLAFGRALGTTACCAALKAAFAASFLPWRCARRRGLPRERPRPPSAISWPRVENLSTLLLSAI